MRLIQSAFLGLGLASPFVLTVACSSSAPEGAEGGACYANATCDARLSCLSDLCVGDDDPNGSGGMSGGGETGSGGRDSSSGGNDSSSGGNDSSSGGSASGGSASGGSASGGSAGTGGEASVPGPELILNGDFVDGINSWSLALNAGGGVYSTANDEVCFEATTELNLSPTLGFPGDVADAFDLEVGTYTLSYSIRGYGEGEVKVGLAESPYTAVDSVDVESFQDEYENHVQKFTVTSAKTTVGLAFNLTIFGYDQYTYTLCVDNVSLRKD